MRHFWVIFVCVMVLIPGFNGCVDGGGGDSGGGDSGGGDGDSWTGEPCENPNADSALLESELCDDFMIVSLSAGSSHTCAWTKSGSALCWGSQSGGQSSPPQGVSFSSITGIVDYNCGITDSKRLECWGEPPIYSKSVAPDGEFRSVDGSRYNTCAVRGDGRLRCWGNGYDSSLLPDSLLCDLWGWCGEKTAGGAPTVGYYEMVGVGDREACALNAENNIICWYPTYPITDYSGWNTSHGYPKDPTMACSAEIEARYAVEDLNSPEENTAEADDSSDEEEAGNAENDESESDSEGDGDEENVADSEDDEDEENDAEEVSPQGSCKDACNAIAADCSCFCDEPCVNFGDCCPDVEEACTRAYFSQIPADMEFKTFSMGWEHLCALTLDGIPMCWGLGLSDQLNAPEEAFVSISAGDHHTCALREDGTGACWGDNTFGQLDIPDMKFKAIAAGGRHSCGILEDGGLWCWGSNDSNQSSPLVGACYTLSTGGNRCVDIEYSGEESTL